MLRKSVMSYLPPVHLVGNDMRRLKCVANYIIAQCCLVFVGALTVVYCVWHPNRLSFDYYKLACVMYLFDRSACGYSMDIAKSVKNLRHIEVSVAIHIIWMLLAIATRIITRNNDNPKMLRFILTTMFYTSILVVAFDLSMAIVYVTHIKQSLTKGMIIRYSGWTVELKDINYNDFGGWLPIAASIAWMRGGIFLALNIYCCRSLYYISQKIKRQEISRKKLQEHNYPIPEANRDSVTDNSVLFYRSGESKPYSRKDITGSYY